MDNKERNMFTNKRENGFVALIDKWLVERIDMKKALMPITSKHVENDVKDSKENDTEQEEWTWQALPTPKKKVSRHSLWIG